MLDPESDIDSPSSPSPLPFVSPLPEKFPGVPVPGVPAKVPLVLKDPLEVGEPLCEKFVLLVGIEPLGGRFVLARLAFVPNGDSALLGVF